MARDVFVVEHIDSGRVPLRVFPNQEAAEDWCVQHCERYLAKIKHQRSGVRPVTKGELFNLGYDILKVPMEV